MRWLLWLTVGLVVVIAALPFIVLSVMGVMRPTEGFCVDAAFRLHRMGCAGGLQQSG